jgi:hypothetical protein
MPLTVPTWIAAVATVVLALGVITAAWTAHRAFVVLSRQLTAQRELSTQLAEVLQLHARGLHQAIDERRRSQACRVFIDLDRTVGDQDPWRVVATVRNTSDQPVYDLYVIWQRGTTRMGKPDPAAKLMPGDDVSFERGPQAGDSDQPADPAALNAFLTFRDTAGIRWTVREDGTLSDIAPASPHP